jgi:hypothetical protein
MPEIPEDADGWCLVAQGWVTFSESVHGSCCDQPVAHLPVHRDINDAYRYMSLLSKANHRLAREVGEGVRLVEMAQDLTHLVEDTHAATAKAERFAIQARAWLDKVT